MISTDRLYRFATLYYKTNNKNLRDMLITISLLILAYLIMGKDITHLVERVKNVDWSGKIIALKRWLYPWALKAGRAATRPLLQFYYVMDDDNTSTSTGC